MPELPEVETVKRGLEPHVLGRRIAKVELRRKDLRFPFPQNFAMRLEGARVDHLGRRAKFILARLSTGETLISHLGMTGRYTILTSNGRTLMPGEFYDDSVATVTADGPHDHVVLHLEDGTRIVYSDPRRFGFMDLQGAGETHKLLSNIGVEPLGNHLTAELLARAFTKKSAPLKAALLDQRIIAGLGNIYVCEVLYRARLSPRRKALTIARRSEKLADIVHHVRNVLTEAIAAGGSTVQDYHGVDGTRGAFQQRFAVYDRAHEPCLTPNCSSQIRRIVQSGRSTFYCPRCQR